MNILAVLCLSAGVLAVQDRPASPSRPLPADTLTLDEMIMLARSANPALRAARLRADAAVERTRPAGTLPDPQLTFGLLNRPVRDYGRTDQAMTMNSFQVMQRLPWPGKLGFREERFRYIAEADRFDADEREVTLIGRITTVYYQLAALDRTITIMSRTRRLLRDFRDVSSTMYSVGTGLQQDVLQAQVAVASMTEDITVARQNRVALAARLNALLGRDPTTSIGALALPLPEGAIPSVDALMARAASARPALQAARARVAAAQAGYRAARRAVYPDFTVTLGYANRPQFDDFVTFMLGITIPLRAGSRQLPLRREMNAMQAMEEAREQDLYNETYARLTELRADAERSRHLSTLYATAILPQARAAVESAAAAYRVGQVDYMTLIQNEMTVNRYEIESVRLLAEFHRARAGIEALIGAVPGATP